MDERLTIGQVTFVWDSRKAAANVRKHGLTFAEASEAFLDPFVFYMGEQVVAGEMRESLIGLNSDWRMVVVTFSYRGEAIRLISAREASKAERRQYEEQ